jgi:glycosyltransferase involved in cell wall biosynthesis
MKQQPITIITPCYNEGITAIRFLETLGNELARLPYLFNVVVVNDCSTDETGMLLEGFRFRQSNMSLHIIALETNVGHQAAILQGFRYAMTMDSDYFIVMDSDGQDAPSAIPMLLQYGNTDIVHVVRNRRSESLPFRVSYYCYKLLFHVATGKRMNYGNFCLISRAVMERAVQAGFSHLAAFLSKQKVKTRYIVADRHKRIGGTSKMKFGDLLLHAFRSFAEYGYGRRVQLLRRGIHGE